MDSPEKSIILFCVVAFTSWAKFFGAKKWWWINPPYLAQPRWPRPEENASLALLAGAVAVGMPLGFGGMSLAAAYGLDGMAWGFISAFVGVLATRPLCTWIWPELIRAGDESAAQRRTALREARAKPEKNVEVKQIEYSWLERMLAAIGGVRVARKKAPDSAQGYRSR